MKKESCYKCEYIILLLILQLRTPLHAHKLLKFHKEVARHTPTITHTSRLSLARSLLRASKLRQLHSSRDYWSRPGNIVRSSPQLIRKTAIQPVVTLCFALSNQHQRIFIIFHIQSEISCRRRLVDLSRAPLRIVCFTLSSSSRKSYFLCATIKLQFVRRLSFFFFIPHFCLLTRSETSDQESTLNTPHSIQKKLTLACAFMCRPQTDLLNFFYDFILVFRVVLCVYFFPSSF